MPRLIHRMSTPNMSPWARLRADVDMVVVHYTGALQASGTLSWFNDPKSQVSAHYVVNRQGDYWPFETIERTLWHAGDSTWMGKRYCNRRSVGVELAATRDSGFTDAQYDTLLFILSDVMMLCPIRYIVGHEHIAPGRKIDPGPLFEWDRLVPATQRHLDVEWLGGEKLRKVLITSHVDLGKPKVTPTPVSQTEDPRMEPGKDPWWHRLVEPFRRG